MNKTDQLLNEAMLILAAYPRALFVGQGVEYSGVATHKHLDDIPDIQRLEFPVAEELQLGVCIGLAIQGYLPIAIYPRMDFMLRAMDALVNHLDKLDQMSCGQFKPKVIIRTRVGSKKPLDAGPQHTQDHSIALRMMLTNVSVIDVTKERDILPAYRAALDRQGSAIVVENLD